MPWQVKVNAVTFELYGFPEEAIAVPQAAEAVAQYLVPDGCFPPLRSNPVYVVREDRPTPLHAADTPDEVILLSCGQNVPWQFSYQFAHELTHLLARSNLRFRQVGSHAWIEEALCGAGSAYAMRKMAAEGGPLLAPGAVQYIAEPCMEKYWSTKGVDKDWFKNNAAEIYAATGETDLTKKIAAVILEACPDGSFMLDNRTLIDTPLDTDLQAYLRSWQTRAPRGAGRVPALLRELALS